MASLLASIRARSSCKPASRQSSILIRSRFSASMLATCAASKACDVSNELRIRATLSMRSSRSTAASFEEFSSCIMIVESARSRSHLSKSRDADSSSRLLASSLFSERRSLFSCSIAWRSVSNCVMVSSSPVARSFVSNSSLLVTDVRSSESSATSLALSELAPSSRACSSCWLAYSSMRNARLFSCWEAWPSKLCNSRCKAASSSTRSVLSAKSSCWYLAIWAPKRDSQSSRSPRSSFKSLVKPWRRSRASSSNE